MSTLRLLVPLALAATTALSGCSAEETETAAPDDTPVASATTSPSAPSSGASSAPSTPTLTSAPPGEDTGDAVTMSSRAFADGTRWQRGPAPSVPYVVGTTLYDGDREIDLPAPVVDVQVTDSGYVVLTDELQALLVDPQGDGTVLGRVANGGIAVPPGGGTVSFLQRGRITVFDTSSGDRIASRSLGDAVVVAADDDRVLVNVDFRSAASRLVWWDYDADETEAVRSGVSPTADVAADRLQVTDEASGRRLTVALSDPGTVIYSGGLGRASCVVDWSSSGYALLGQCAGDGLFSVATRVVDPDGGQVADIDFPVVDAVWQSAESFLAVSADERTTQVLACEAEVLCLGATDALEVTAYDPLTGELAPRVQLAGN